MSKPQFGPFTDLFEWIKPLCRFNNLEDFVILNYTESDRRGGYKNVLRLRFFTKDHEYHLSARLSERSKFASEHGDKKGYDDGYLGCIAQTRKPRAGEDWNRGRDLADGSYSKETFDEIVRDILAFELVKVAKPIKGQVDTPPKVK